MAKRSKSNQKLMLARILGKSGSGAESRASLLEAILMFARALAAEHRLPEPPELKDALQSPLSHCWAETLPVLKTYIQEPKSDWKQAAECLGALRQE